MIQISKKLQTLRRKREYLFLHIYLILGDMYFAEPLIAQLEKNYGYLT
jgi:hypothetical protein